MSDLISRNEVLTYLNNLHYAVAGNRDISAWKAIGDAKKVIYDIPSAETKIIHCKNCAHFHYDYWANVNGVPLIVGHEICDFWGNGCKTKEEAFCSYAERRTDE